MEREGHLGTMLLLGAFALIGLGLFEGLVATAVMVVADRLPDQDQYIPDSIIHHRGLTHSLMFTLIVAFVAASTIAYPTRVGQQVAIEFDLLSTTVISPTRLWLFLSGAVTVSLLGHIATDALTKGGGYKVEPLWPLSSWSVALGFCTSDDEWWNAALLASGGTAFFAAVLHELYYSILPTVVGL